MMTDWYQKSINTLQLNGKAERTQKAYTQAVRMLSTFYGKSRDEITEPELEAYFLRRRNVDHNRHCPCCQQGKGLRWLERHQARHLPGEHFLLTFPVPEPLRAFLRRHQKIGYGALFTASAGAVKTLAADPKYIGGDLAGFFGVLHTWGALCSTTPTFTMSCRGSPEPRRRALASISAGVLFARASPVADLSRQGPRRDRPARAARGDAGRGLAMEWNVNCQAAGDGRGALEYLAHYVFQVAISERRILHVDEHHVRFRYHQPHSRPGAHHDAADHGVHAASP